MEGIQLNIDKKVLDFMVEKAVEFKLGARGLRAICEAVLLDSMFELPSSADVKEFRVTLNYAKGKLDKSAISKLRVAS